MKNRPRRHSKTAHTDTVCAGQTITHTNPTTGLHTHSPRFQVGRYEAMPRGAKSGRATGSPLGGVPDLRVCVGRGCGSWWGCCMLMQSGIHVRGVNALLLPCYSCFWLFCCGRDNGLFSAVVFPLITKSTNDLHITDYIFPALRVRNNVICFRACWCLRLVKVKSSAADRTVLDAVSSRVSDREGTGPAPGCSACA